MRQIDAWLRANLFDEVPVNICVIDPAFRIVKANRHFEEAYGPWAGRPCYEVYKGRQSRCEDCAAVQTFNDGVVRSLEQEGSLRGNGGRAHYLVHMVPIVRPQGGVPYVIEMSTDITPVKRLEQEKREAERLAAVAGVPLETVYRKGRKPADGIAAAAKRARCDLIIIRSHGLSTLGRLLLGSVTASLIAVADVPVLVLPQPSARRRKGQ